MKLFHLKAVLIHLHVNDWFKYTKLSIPKAIQQIGIPYSLSAHEDSIINHESVLIQFTIQDRSVIHIFFKIQ